MCVVCRAAASLGALRQADDAPVLLSALLCVLCVKYLRVSLCVVCKAAASRLCGRPILMCL